MRRIIIIVSLFVVGIFASHAQDYCDTLKWKSLKTFCLYLDGSSFHRVGELDSAIINIDTLPIFYLGHAGLNISNDTFYANEEFTLLATWGIFTDTGAIGFSGQAFIYDFVKDFVPNDTLRTVYALSFNLPPLINQIKEDLGVELEEISYWQVIIGVAATSKDGIYSDSVFYAGADTSVFYVVRGGVGIAGRPQGSPVLVYPNPTGNQLRVTIGGEYHSPIQYSIYSVVGQVVMVGAYPCGRPEITIDVSHLTSGMYFLKVDGKTVRFVKE